MVSAYSIGTSKRTEQKGNDNPGPLEYQPKPKPKVQPPEWSFGRATRKWRSNSEGPGPGEYNAPDKITKEGVKYTMGTKTIYNQFKSDAPGPGSYELSFSQILKKPPQYSLAMKTETGIQFDQNPGPGAYNLNTKILEHNSSIKFPLSSRVALYNQDSNSGPGPGGLTNDQIKAYQIQKGDSLIFQKTTPQWVIGTGKRDDNSLNEVKRIPGPGAYQLQSLLQTQKGFTLGGKRNNSSSAMSQSYGPGPGAYNELQGLKKVRGGVPAYSIGNGPRDGFSVGKDKSASQMPGPGAYDNHTGSSNLYRVQGSVKIGTSKRQPLSESEYTPGPGAYDVKLQQEGPKVIITGGRTEPFRFDRGGNPGPGQYQPNLEVVKQRPTTSKMGTSVRQPLHQTSSTTIGPGYYNIRGKIPGPTWVFNRSPRAQSVEKQRIPGPGQYNIPPAFADVPKYLLNQPAQNSKF